MQQLQRHVGRVSNTGTTCVVVMNEIPEKEDCALIVETDSLPPKYNDQFAELVMSHEAQQTPDLANLLNRRIFGSTGRAMLQELHAEGHLRSMPVVNITMLVTKHNTMPLVDIVNAMRLQKGKGLLPGTDAPQDITTPEAIATAVLDNSNKVKNPTVIPVQEIDVGSQKELIQAKGVPDVEKARNLVIEADILENEAKNMKQSAYKLDPSLKPRRGRPKKV